MLKYLFTALVAAFLLGVVSANLAGNLMEAYPLLTQAASGVGSSGVGTMALANPNERPSPFPRIQKEDIHVQKDRVIIELKNPQWATFTNTNSMDPVLDEGHYALQVVPESFNDVHVGDIITYEYPGVTQGNLIHRVVQVGFDDQGWYAIAKGDNNTLPDPGRVRFSQIKKVVAAIIY